MKALDHWQVHPHKPLEKLEANLWRVEGDLPGTKGRRVMTIAKLEDGRLVIHNGIALEEDLMKEIEAFGEPAYLVVPNGYHRLDAKIYKQRYPKMKVLAPAGGRKKVEQVVPVDATYDGTIDDTVRLDHVRGLKDAEGVMTVKHGANVTLVLNDAVFNMPKIGGVMGFMLAPTGEVAVPRVMRWFIVKDRRAFQSHLEELAKTPGLVRVIVSHGKVIAENPGEMLKAAASRL